MPKKDYDEEWNKYLQEKFANDPTFSKLYAENATFHDVVWTLINSKPPNKETTDFIEQGVKALSYIEDEPESFFTKEIFLVSKKNKKGKIFNIIKAEIEAEKKALVESLNKPVYGEIKGFESTAEWYDEDIKFYGKSPTQKETNKWEKYTIASEIEYEPPITFDDINKLVKDMYEQELTGISKETAVLDSLGYKSRWISDKLYVSNKEIIDKWYVIQVDDYVQMKKLIVPTPQLLEIKDQLNKNASKTYELESLKLNDLDYETIFLNGFKNWYHNKGKGTPATDTCWAALQAVKTYFSSSNKNTYYAKVKFWNPVVDINDYDWQYWKTQDTHRNAARKFYIERADEFKMKNLKYYYVSPEQYQELFNIERAELEVNKTRKAAFLSPYRVEGRIYSGHEEISPHMFCGLPVIVLGGEIKAIMDEEEIVGHYQGVPGMDPPKSIELFNPPQQISANETEPLPSDQPLTRKAYFDTELNCYTIGDGPIAI